MDPCTERGVESEPEPSAKELTEKALQANIAHQHALTRYAKQLEAELQELDGLIVSISILLHAQSPPLTTTYDLERCRLPRRRRWRFGARNSNTRSEETSRPVPNCRIFKSRATSLLHVGLALIISSQKSPFFEAAFRRTNFIHNTTLHPSVFY